MDQKKIMYLIGCHHIDPCIGQCVGRYSIDTRPTCNCHAARLLTKSKPPAHWKIGQASTNVGRCIDYDIVSSLSVNLWWYISQLSSCISCFSCFVPQSKTISKTLSLTTTKQISDVLNIDHSLVDCWLSNMSVIHWLAVHGLISLVISYLDHTAFLEMWKCGFKIISVG